MSQYRLTPAAQADLESIWEYTVANWSEAQAERYIRDIQTSCEGLISGATVSRSAEDIRAGYRKAATGSHVMFFKQSMDGVVIVRILHQRMDIERHL
jgi:toxin ParE1/3/4